MTLASTDCKVMASGCWFRARPSGSGANHRIYAESFRAAEHLKPIRAQAHAIVDATRATSA